MSLARVVARPGRLCALLSLFISGWLLPPALFAQAGDYIVAKGDQLLITVWGFPEFSTSATVRDDGSVSIPLVGDVPAAGLRRDEFISGLRRKLADYIQGEIKVTVSVLASSAQRVSVLGAVNRPDNYPLVSDANLLDILSAAGGATPEANLNHVQIFRKDKAQPALVIDLESYMERAELDKLPKMRAGDVVFFPRQRNFLKEFGEYLGYVVVFFALVRITEGGSN